MPRINYDSGPRHLPRGRRQLGRQPLLLIATTEHNNSVGDNVDLPRSRCQFGRQPPLFGLDGWQRGLQLERVEGARDERLRDYSRSLHHDYIR